MSLAKAVTTVTNKIIDDANSFREGGTYSGSTIQGLLISYITQLQVAVEAAQGTAGRDISELASKVELVPKP